jgi:PAS domain S-box-containing protein
VSHPELLIADVADDRLLNALPHGVLAHDSGGRIVAANDAMVELVGLARDSLIGASAPFSFWPEASDSEQERVRREYLSGKAGAYRMKLGREGRVVVAEVAVGPMEGGFVAIFRKASEHGAEQLLNAKFEANQVLNEAQSLQEAAPRVLAALGRHIGWVYGALWRPSRTRGALRCETIWHGDGGDFAALDGMMRELEMEAGVGLPGRAVERREALWITDMATEPGMIRAAALAKADLHSAAAVPIVVDRQVMGVLELFGREARAADENVLRMLTHLATHIGQFIHRRQIEQQTARLMMQIESNRQRIEALLANVPGVVWEAYGSPEGEGQRIDFVSRYAEQLVGFSTDVWVSTPNFWLMIVHVEDRERALREMTELYRAGKGGVVSFRWVAKDGRILWVESTTTIIFDENGKGIGMRGVTVDVTARKKGQRALRRRAKQLERSTKQLLEKNRELDQFAYVASHDLRAPLRGIANLSNWIEEDMGDKFTPEAHKQMELLRGRVHRMENLINGLLEFSRIGRVEAAQDEVDLNVLLKEVVDLMDPPEGVTIEVAENLPTVTTERLRIQQVFMNLIGNGIKHRGNQNVTIRVTCQPAAGGYEFTVADNGPGIPPEYHEKIFVIFQTLVARDKVEGTGVGLALVKKIVENHGGAIRVESKPGEGAKFIFTWPKKQWKGKS